MKKRWTKSFGIPAAVLIGCMSVWLSASYSRDRRDPPPGDPGMTLDKQGVSLAPGVPQWQMLKLGVVKSAGPLWTDLVPARVVIDETRTSKVQAPLSGRVTRVMVELGQKVRAGDPLFSVTSPEIADLRAEQEKASVDFEAAQASLERTKSLVASRALPAKEELLARQQFRDAEVALRQASAKLDSLRVSAEGENEFTLVAPRAGVVVEKNVLVGQSVTPEAGSALMVVADLSEVWVVANLFESEAGGVREGAAAEVSSPSVPNRIVRGSVDTVSAVVDPDRHTVPIRVSLPNPDGTLRPNVYARVRFSVGQAEGTMEIPATALITDGMHQYVYVQSTPGRFARREIQAGSAREGRVPVLSGLTQGETIVDEGGILLDNALILGT